jgi:hypothetical protein
MVQKDRRRIARGQDTKSAKPRIRQSEVGNPEERQVSDRVGSRLSDWIIS